jgi:hypothetical protein
VRTKWFIILRAGKTIDGREVTAGQIDQMAASYNPALYGARVNVEHLTAILPDSPLAALGDVLALRADTDTDGTRVLKAQVEATPQLLHLSQTRQKVYWSAEIHPQMPATGGAYLMGLAVTDRPASLGTEMMRFSASGVSQIPIPDASRGHLFTPGVEMPGVLELEGPAQPGLSGTPAPAAPPSPPSSEPGLMERVRVLLTGQDRRADARLAGLESASVEIAGAVGAMRSDLQALLSAPRTPSPGSTDGPPTPSPATAAGTSAPAPVSPAAPTPAPGGGDVAALSARVDQLVQVLSQIPATAGRPLATGAPATQATDC